MLEALAQSALGERSAALRITAAILRETGEEGLSRFMLEEPGMAALIESVRAQHVGLAATSAPDLAYLERLVARARAPSLPAEHAGAAETLSEREADILDMLTRGLSNRDIGARIFVSENTVKYHLKNIYAKLGAKNRTEACNVARARGLLAM
jgi:LuxR family maltose regulon positive regulatory protein